MPTITATKVTKVLDHQPADRPDGKNLRFDIKIKPSESTARIHSREEESVGTHKKRKVTFCADHDCVIVFSNPDVFVDPEPAVSLTAHKATDLEIKDTTPNPFTFFDILTGTTVADATEAMPQEMITRNGPKIVVP